MRDLVVLATLLMGAVGWAFGALGYELVGQALIGASYVFLSICVLWEG